MAGRFRAGTNANPTLTLPAAGWSGSQSRRIDPQQARLTTSHGLEGECADLDGASRDGVGLPRCRRDEVSTPVRAVARQMTTSARARFRGAGRLRIRP